jgi:hypothetical protein
MVHVELYGKFFLGDRLQKSDVSEIIFAAFFRRLYHTYDCVFMVALEICVMWLLLLIHPSATAQDGAGLNVSDTQNCTHLV